MDPTVAIEVKNLMKKYKKIVAVDDISFTIRQGDFFGLLGQNGAGKSTAIGILCGLVNKTSGSVKIFGHDVEKKYREARAKIGLVPQEFNMDKFEEVRRVLLFNAGYFGLPKHQREARVDKLLKDLGLWDKRVTRVLQLSGGMKRKLMIARALLHEPEILILDEPTAGVDVESRHSMWRFLQDLNEKGTTILLTTHYIEEAERLCGRLGIVHDGKIIAMDDKDRLLRQFGSEIIVVTLTKQIKQIDSARFGYPVEVQDNFKLIVRVPKESFNYEDFLRKINDLPVERIETRKATLEDIFVKLTKKRGL